MGIAEKLSYCLQEELKKRGANYCEVEVDAINLASLALCRKMDGRIIGEFNDGGVKRVRLCVRI